MSESLVFRIMSAVRRVSVKFHVSMRPLQRALGLFLPHAVYGSKKSLELSNHDDEDLAPLFARIPDKHFGSSIWKNEVACPADYDLQIIIPVYNVEAYVGACMDSVVKQSTRYRVLIVVVNDGSPDKSREVLSRYEKADNVVIIDQENKGYSGARNAGLKHINARYIMFIDSDDILAGGAIDAMMDAAIKYDADVVEGSYKRLLNGQLVTGTSHQFYKGSQWEDRLNGYVWGKVYRSELFHDVCFPDGYLSEDSLIAAVIYPQCKTFVTIPDNVYTYRVNYKGASMSSMGKPVAVESILVTIQLLEDNAHRGWTPTQKDYDNFLREDVFNDFFIIKQLNDTDLNHRVFSIKCRLLTQYYGAMQTADKNLLRMEHALRTGDYRQYVVEAFNR